MAGTTINPYRFGGQLGYRRDGTNRNYVRARHLDTQRGKWLNTDPMQFASGDANLYRYSYNDPVQRVDPSGMDPTATFNVQQQYSACNHFGCGSFAFVTNIVGIPRMTGWIIQHVTKRRSWIYCHDGYTKSETYQYWEALKVDYVNGKYTFYSCGQKINKLVPQDELGETASPGSSGSITKVLHSKFVQHIPVSGGAGWGCNKVLPDASGSYATYGPVPGWTDAGGGKKSVVLNYNCCCTPHTETIQIQPNGPCSFTNTF